MNNPVVLVVASNIFPTFRSDTKYAFVAYDPFVKHLAFYIQDEIDVGIEILPMKSMQKKMSSGIGYYEGELYNILRHGKNIPAVPLVIIGIDS